MEKEEYKILSAEEILELAPTMYANTVDDLPCWCAYFANILLQIIKRMDRDYETNS